MTEVFGQSRSQVRFDWGPVGARAVDAQVTLIIDVLSFSTAVTVAVERGMQVVPYRWRGPDAQRFADRTGAVLAVGRSRAPGAAAASGSGTSHPPSLSPAGLLTCDVVPRLVLPSPNGSTIAAERAEAHAAVAIGCLRNAGAAASWAAAALESGCSVAVIAAGERWASDDSLRPAIEDQVGAGAILAGLIDLGHGAALSPEARVAAGTFQSGRGLLGDLLRGSVSGRELIARGYGADVEVALDFDGSSVVPVLTDGAFTAAG